MNEFIKPRQSKDGKVIICIGNHKASKKEFETIEEAQRYIDSKPWELIYMTAIFASIAKEEMDNNKNKEE